MDVEDVVALRRAVDDCGDRGLLAASKWHAPLLMKREMQGLRITTIGQLIYYNVCRWNCVHLQCDTPSSRRLREKT